MIIITVKLPWIFQGAPLILNGAPGNIQDNFKALFSSEDAVISCEFETYERCPISSVIDNTFREYWLIVPSYGNNPDADHTLGTGKHMGNLSRGVCNMVYPSEAHPQLKSRVISLVALKFCTEWYCCAWCKFSKRLDNWFRDLSVQHIIRARSRHPGQGQVITSHRCCRV